MYVVLHGIDIVLTIKAWLNMQSNFSQKLAKKGFAQIRKKSDKSLSNGS